MRSPGGLTVARDEKGAYTMAPGTPNMNGEVEKSYRESKLRRSCCRGNPETLGSWKRRGECLRKKDQMPPVLLRGKER